MKLEVTIYVLLYLYPNKLLCFCHIDDKMIYFILNFPLSNSCQCIKLYTEAAQILLKLHWSRVNTYTLKERDC